MSAWTACGRPAESGTWPVEVVVDPPEDISDLVGVFLIFDVGGMLMPTAEETLIMFREPTPGADAFVPSDDLSLPAATMYAIDGMIVATSPYGL